MKHAAAARVQRFVRWRLNSQGNAERIQAAAAFKHRRNLERRIAHHPTLDEARSDASCQSNNAHFQYED